MPKPRKDSLAVLIPKAVRYRSEGLTWPEVARRVGRGERTVKRWPNRPEWAEAEAAVRKEHEEVLEAAGASVREEAISRAHRIEVLRARVLDIAEKEVAIYEDRVLENLTRAKRTSKRNGYEVVDPRTGDVQVFDEVKIEQVDSAAAAAAKSVNGQGLQRKIEIALGAPIVAREPKATDEERESRRIEMARDRRGTIDEFRKAKRAAAGAGDESA